MGYHSSDITIMSNNNNSDTKYVFSLSSGILQSIPAGVPPPGTEPNFTVPPTLVPVILGITTTFLALALLCYSVRIYTKIFITRNRTLDDGEQQ